MTESKSEHDMRIKIKETIIKALENKKSVAYKRTIANFILETGFNEGFIKKVIQAMEEAGLIYINTSKDTINFSIDK